jgi:hypothetical protein
MDMVPAPLPKVRTGLQLVVSSSASANNSRLRVRLSGSVPRMEYLDKRNPL